MVKRRASGQDALDRSPKRTQLIDLVSDSESELPDLDFSRLSHLSQKMRKCVQGDAVTLRDSRPAKTEAEGEGDGDEDEDEPTQTDLDIKLASDHTDCRRDLSIEADVPDLHRSNFANTCDRSPTLEQGETVRSSGRRAASFTSDTPDNCSDAGPSDTVDHIASPVQSSPTRPTSPSAEAVATSLSTVHPTGSHLTDPGCSKPANISNSSQTQRQSSMIQSSGYRMTPCTGEVHANAGDPGSSGIPGRAAAPAESLGAQAVSAEDLTRRSSMSRPIDPVAPIVTKFASTEPAVPPHSAADQEEIVDDALAIARQGPNRSVENTQHFSEQAHTSSTDFDDLMLIVEDIKNMPAKDLDIVWNQLSESLQHRTADQWKSLYVDKVLPTFEAKRLVACLAARKLDRSRSDIQQPSQSVRQSCTAIHAARDNDSNTHKDPIVTRRHESASLALQSDVLPASEPTPDQLSNCVQGTVRFINCKKVNIASGDSQRDKVSSSDSKARVAPTVVNGDLVFEGCEEVNILSSRDLTSPNQRRRRRLHKIVQHPAQPTQEHPRSQTPREQQHQVPWQPPKQTLHTLQPARPDASLAASVQSHPPTQLPTQTRTYGPTLPLDTHDHYQPQAYHSGPSQAHLHAQDQSQSWPQIHPYNQIRARVQMYYQAPQHAQQVAPEIHPQAYSRPPQIASYDHPFTHQHEAVQQTHRDGRHWDSQAPEEYEGMDDDDEDEEFEEDEESD